jgi:phytol kinase
MGGVPVADFAIRTGVLLLYYLFFCALLPVFYKQVLHIDNEWARKSQHLAYALSVLVLLHVFEVWWLAALSCLVLVVVAFPVLYVLEKTEWYQRSMTDRLAYGGELRESLLLVQVSFIVMFAVFWGILGEAYKPVIATATLTWGFGDAAAALLGKRFGKTTVKVIGVDEKKTFFGSNAMTVVSFVTLFLMLFFYARHPWTLALLTAVLAAPFVSALELFSKKGFDTVVVPIGCAIFLTMMILLYQYVGWMI